MVRCRRRDNLVLNFDSLTDTVTNLSGTLIVVVVLVLGMARAPRGDGTTGSVQVDGLLHQAEVLRLQIQSVCEETQKLEQELPLLRSRIEKLRKKSIAWSPGLPVRGTRRVPGTSGRAGLLAGPPVAAAGRVEPALVAALLLGGAPRPDAPVASPLDVQTAWLIEHLQLVIQTSHADLQGLEARLPRLGEQFEQLCKEVEILRPTEKKPAPAQAPPPENIYFRPPIEQFTTQRAIVFSCEEGGVDFIDLEVVNRELQRLREARDPKTTKKESFCIDLPDSDSFCEGYLEGRLGSPEFTARAFVVRKPGKKGETPAELHRPGSRFQRALALFRPSQRYVNFGVLPDSFEVFRQAREIAWKAGYDVGWVPLNTAEAMELGAGPGKKY